LLFGLLDRARPLLRHGGGVAKPKILSGGHVDHAISIGPCHFLVKRNAGLNARRDRIPSRGVAKRGHFPGKSVRVHHALDATDGPDASGKETRGCDIKKHGHWSILDS